MAKAARERAASSCPAGCAPGSVNTVAGLRGPAHTICGIAASRSRRTSWPARRAPAGQIPAAALPRARRAGRGLRGLLTTWPGAATGWLLEALAEDSWTWLAPHARPMLGWMGNGLAGLRGTDLPARMPSSSTHDRACKCPRWPRSSRLYPRRSTEAAVRQDASGLGPIVLSALLFAHLAPAAASGRQVRPTGRHQDVFPWRHLAWTLVEFLRRAARRSAFRLRPAGPGQLARSGQRWRCTWLVIAAWNDLFGYPVLNSVLCVLCNSIHGARRGRRGHWTGHSRANGSDRRGARRLSSTGA